MIGDNFLPFVNCTSSNEDISNKPQCFHRSVSYRLLDIELNSESCQTCITSSHTINLYKYNEIPQFLKGNPFVLSGYRVDLPAGLCLRSLIQWNNETLNIWSHLLGFILFFVVMLFDNFYIIPINGGSIAEHVACTVGLLCYQFTMLASAGYHIFSCHSERASRRWLAIDLAGICIGLCGCYVPAIHFAFYCLSIWRDIYLLVILFLSGGVLALQLHPRWFNPDLARLRICLFCGLAGYGLIPAAHWIYLSGGWTSTIVQLFIHKVVIMYCIGLVALFFYLSKLPERCMPGKLDYVGHSHQCWHLAVVLAFWFWHSAGLDFMLYRITHSCSYP